MEKNKSFKIIVEFTESRGSIARSNLAGAESMRASRARDPGSNPGRGTSLIKYFDFIIFLYYLIKFSTNHSLAAVLDASNCLT